MADIVWTSPKGHYTVITVVPEGYENETREEKAERLGADFGIQPVVDEETPEEKEAWRQRALANIDEWYEEIGFEPPEDVIADLDALCEYVGWKPLNGEAWSN